MTRSTGQTDRAARPASLALGPRRHSFPADPRQVGSARRFLLDLLTGSSAADDAACTVWFEV